MHSGPYLQSREFLKGAALSRNKAFLFTLWLSAHLQLYNSASHLAAAQTQGFSSDQPRLCGLMWAHIVGAGPDKWEPLRWPTSQHRSDKVKRSCCHYPSRLLCCGARYETDGGPSAPNTGDQITSTAQCMSPLHSRFTGEHIANKLSIKTQCTVCVPANGFCANMSLYKCALL